jgi:hypothetical protein
MTAHAEWKPFGDTNNLDTYIDYSRIRTEGLHKSIWTLYDLKSSETSFIGKPYKSEVLKRVVDCQRSRIQTVAIYYYSEQMGKGSEVFSANYLIKESRWIYPAPNSMFESFIQEACATNNNPKPTVNNAQDIKRQKCIRLGLAPNSADFQQCVK